MMVMMLTALERGGNKLQGPVKGLTQLLDSGAGPARCKLITRKLSSRGNRVLHITGGLVQGPGFKIGVPAVSSGRASGSAARSTHESQVENPDLTVLCVPSSLEVRV